VALEVEEDIEECPEGRRVPIRRSKTDQEGTLCAVRQTESIHRAFGEQDCFALSSSGRGTNGRPVGIALAPLDAAQRALNGLVGQLREARARVTILARR
jgi:hypothetical protein